MLFGRVHGEIERLVCFLSGWGGGPTCSPPCTAPLICSNGQCILGSPLQFVLSWTNGASNTDLDLWVSYNNQAGCTIYYSNRGTLASPVCGGFLYQDVVGSASGEEITAYSTPSNGAYYVVIDPYTFPAAAAVELVVKKNGVATVLLPSTPLTNPPLPSCPTTATPFAYANIPKYSAQNGKCLGFTVNWP